LQSNEPERAFYGAPIRLVMFESNANSETEAFFI